jgi:hypothetical protein
MITITLPVSLWRMKNDRMLSRIAHWREIVIACFFFQAFVCYSVAFIILLDLASKSSANVFWRPVCVRWMVRTGREAILSNISLAHLVNNGCVATNVTTVKYSKLNPMVLLIRLLIYSTRSTSGLNIIVATLSLFVGFFTELHLPDSLLLSVFRHLLTRFNFILNSTLFHFSK